MGISNLHAGLENEIACHRGELQELQKDISEAKILIARLPEMLERVSRLEEVIEAAEKLVKFRKPDWQSSSIKPRRRTAHYNPIPFGNTSVTALDVLREAIRCDPLCRKRRTTVLPMVSPPRGLYDRHKE